MRKKTKIRARLFVAVLSAYFSIFPLAASEAKTIHLKSGTVIEGEVKRETGDFIVLVLPDGSEKIVLKSKIASADAAVKTAAGAPTENVIYDKEYAKLLEEFFKVSGDRPFPVQQKAKKAFGDLQRFAARHPGSVYLSDVTYFRQLERWGGDPTQSELQSIGREFERLSKGPRDGLSAKAVELIETHFPDHPGEIFRLYSLWVDHVKIMPALVARDYEAAAKLAAGIVEKTDFNDPRQKEAAFDDMLLLMGAYEGLGDTESYKRAKERALDEYPQHDAQLREMP